MTIYTQLFKSSLVRNALAMMLAGSLSACLGGSIAQQIVRTIITSSADKVVANALDEHDRKELIIQQNKPLKDTVPDKYWAAFITSGFETIQPIVMPLPNNVEEAEIIKPTQSATLVAAPLVRVVMFNLLIGEEKNKILESARALGATALPDKAQWAQWQVATGVIEGNKKLITFLIPPEFGKMPSGAKAMVEIATLGELNVLRYASN